MENEVRGLTIRLGADVSELTSALDGAKHTVDELGESLNAASEEAARLAATLESLPSRD